MRYRALIACACASFALAAPRAPMLEDVASRTGLGFVHHAGDAGQFYMPEVMGAGAALVDFDDDGDLDVYVLDGQPLGAGASPEPAHTHRLFRNDLTPAGELRFTDVTAESGLGVTGYGMGVAAGDYDNDGDQDLYVTAFGPNRLFRNNGDGTFTDVTAAARVGDDRWSSSAAFLDYDRDGDLDLFVANYLDFTIAANKQCFDAAGARDYCGPQAFRPVPDRLFRNEGDGTFADVAEPAGITRADGAGLGIAVSDYDGDGWLDLYVANDATPNQLWLNQHDGTFRDEGPLSGAALNAAGNPEGSMGIASGDFDNDGDDDLFVTNIVGETFALYVNDGAGSFDDGRVRAGVAQPTAPVTGFGTDWFDLDNDGWLDLFIANGAVNVIAAQRGQPRPYRMRNQLLRNRGDGRFADISAEAGPALSTLDVSRGAAFGDIDNDGDVDVLVTVNNGPVRLLRNQIEPRGSFLTIALDGGPAHRPTVGAQVTVRRAGMPDVRRRARTAGSYLVSQDPRVHVGLGPYAGAVDVSVQWPDGVKEEWRLPGVNRQVTLRRGSSR